MSLFEINEAASIVSEAADPQANIIFGAVIDETMETDIKVTVIATGFEGLRSAAIGQRRDTRFGGVRQLGIETQRGGDRTELDIPAFLRRRSRGSSS